MKEPLALPAEDEVARGWWALPPGCLLPLSSGDTYRLYFSGRRGGSAGPDVRDAVFYRVRDGADALCETGSATKHAHRLAGDVEFHVRSSDWIQHRHYSDVRYNRVVLHVVLLCDDPQPTCRQDGAIVPVCSLHDLPLAWLNSAGQPTVEWPCRCVMQRTDSQAYTRMLQQAGWLRFEQKAHAFVERLHIAIPDAGYDVHDMYLVPALAEGLGYGRDREFFHAAGLRIVGQANALPEPLGCAAQPAPLDAGRLRVLARMVVRWRTPGVWQTLRALLLDASYATMEARLSALQHGFEQFGLSQARAAILICNVALPFALAVALIEQDDVLAACAQTLYMQHPGLPSNRVTRMMCAQLGLSREPAGSCAQQGSHYIYQQTCREKQCDVCLVGRRF